MIYKTIVVEFKDNKKRFNRTIMVREDINLVELGCVLCTALGTQYEHNFLFMKNKNHYVPDCFLEDSWEDSIIRDRPMKEFELSDLRVNFQFLYDTGENWLFDCKVLKEDTMLNEEELAYLISGNGQGIWEDNIDTLMHYLDGDLDPNTSSEDIEEEIYFPWNFEINKLSDFDTAYDVLKEKETFNEKLKKDIEIYLKGCHSYGYELEIDPRHKKNDYGYNRRSVNIHYLKMIDGQIDNFDFVGEKYKELLKKYDNATARNLLAKALADEYRSCNKKHEPMYMDNYKKRIEGIK